MEKEKLVLLEHIKEILPVYEEHILNRMLDNLPKVIEPLYGDIPSIFFDGAMPAEKTYVPLEVRYVSRTEKFHSYIYAKLQGSSTYALPKKNIDIVMYTDEQRHNGLYKNFNGWGKANHFVLKAEYNDILHARNVVCSKLWSKVVASRADYDSLPETLKNSPNNGSVDGFPVKVYVNGNYEGLYNLIIPKGAWLLGLDETNPNHAMIEGRLNDEGDYFSIVNPCNFQTAWTDDGSHKDSWEIIVGNDRSTIQESWNQIVSQYTLSVDEITYDIDLNLECIDIQSAIDYFVFQDIILGTDGLARNMIMFTVDMKKWYLSARDLDCTFDLSWEGDLLDASETVIGQPPYMNNYSALLKHLKINYSEEMKARYFELRNSVLSEASIIHEFENYVNVYGEDLYIQDTVPYPDIPHATENSMTRLKKFIYSHMEFLDKYYGGEN